MDINCTLLVVCILHSMSYHPLQLMLIESCAIFLKASQRSQHALGNCWLRGDTYTVNGLCRQVTRGVQSMPPNHQPTTTQQQGILRAQKYMLSDLLQSTQCSSDRRCVNSHCTHEHAWTSQCLGLHQACFPLWAKLPSGAVYCPIIGFDPYWGSLLIASPEFTLCEPDIIRMI
jgi:hypothetical protein